MTSFLIQSTFQFGEVSPLEYARVDSQLYSRFARKLRNVVTIPQGGVERRFGTKYIAPIGGGVTDYTQIKPEVMDYEDGERYLFIFRNLAIDIYHDDALVQTIVSNYATSEIQDLDTAQSPNLLFIAHGSHKPGILRRATTAHDSWALEDNPTFVNYPTYDFSQNYDAITFQVKVAGVVIGTSQNVLGTTVTLEASAALFTANHAGGLFFADGGTLRITTFNSSTSVDARIVSIFDSDSSLFHDTNTILGTDVVLTEVAFSDLRGWPKKVSFFQSRIWFANTFSLPGGIFGSNYNGFTYNTFNYDDSESLATNAVSTVLYARRAAVIQHMVAYKSLLIFTTSGLFSTPLFEEVPITPTNINYINLQTADASGTVSPQILDNQVIFFDKGGKKVKDVNLVGRTGTYDTSNISVLAPHLIDQPNSAGVYENSTEKDGVWLFLTMTGTTLDGGLSIYQAVPEQQISAWTHSTTDGKFRYVVADENTVYFIVERTINSATVLYIEKLDWTIRTDCAKVVTGAPFTVVTGLDHLIGKDVRVIGDGAIMITRTVSASGEITLEYPVSSVEVGLNYVPTIEPMPLNVPTQMGNNIYLPKSVKKLYVDYYESAGITVNGELIPSFQFNSDEYDQYVVPKTNFYAVSPFNGWDPRAIFTISQNDPLPFTLIGIGFEIEQ